jgi:hypothetical protein
MARADSQVLPGIEVAIRGATIRRRRPALVLSPSGALLHTARDREEEVAGFARWVRASVREDETVSLDRVALVVHQRLPYAYLTRTVLDSAGIPSQMFDALPLAAEPYAAALDVLLSCVAPTSPKCQPWPAALTPFRLLRARRAPLRAADIAPRWTAS